MDFYARQALSLDMAGECLGHCGCHPDSKGRGHKPELLLALAEAISVFIEMFGLHGLQKELTKFAHVIEVLGCEKAIRAIERETKHYKAEYRRSHKAAPKADHKS